MNSTIRVSGHIISELSEKIPSNIIALNELIKNSYDAGAKTVDIVLDTHGKFITISDNGSGMDKSDIDTLFHISNSTKQYGKLNEFKRFTQGSKGLGFLSVFKFGKYVEWKTKKRKGFKFNLSYEDLVAIKDISQYEVPIEEDPSIKKGTKIQISLDDYNVDTLKKYFSVEKNYKKITNSFIDKKFTINLDIDGKKYSSKDTKDILDNSKEHQLYHVVYTGKSQKIQFFHNGNEVITQAFPFHSKRFALDINLVIYQFPPYGKEKIDSLFLNQNDDLTPLLYVNSNLFNNYALFDPNLMKNIKTSQVLNQMIGYISITSDDALLNFNSDRTQFLQNEFSDLIIEFLATINRRIQEIGSEYKKYLMNFDIATVPELPHDCASITDISYYKKYIKSDFAFKERVVISHTKNKIKFSLFGKEVSIPIKSKPQNAPVTSETNDKGDNGNNSSETPTQEDIGAQSTPDIIPAAVKLKTFTERLAIPTEQLDLKKYVLSANDSVGSKLSPIQLEIKANGVILAGGILPSITAECQKTIEFSYTDPQTGLVSSKLSLEFYQPTSPITGVCTNSKLISLPSKQGYIASYNYNISKLIQQINGLNYSNYLELISCSLRSIFEISVDEIIKSSKFSHISFSSDLEPRVVQVINYIKNSRAFMTAIDKSTKIGYHNLNNMLDAQKFQSGISTAHLAAHKSGSYISSENVLELARLAGVFIVLTNEMLNNSNIA